MPHAIKIRVQKSLGMICVPIQRKNRTQKGNAIQDTHKVTEKLEVIPLKLFYYQTFFET